MSVIALPRNRVWTQPVAGLRIDWSNPITRGLVYCVIGDMVIDLASGKLSSRSVTNGTITNSVTQAGVGLKFSGANSVKASRKILGNGDASILLVGDPASESNGRALARHAGGIGEIYLITNSDHAGGGGVPGQMCWLWLQSGVERSAILVPSVIDGKLHTHVITKSSGAASAFVDGAKKSISIFGSLSNSLTSAADTYQVGGNDQSSATSPNCTINANFVWNRRLADGEAALVSANPLLIFAPRSAPLFVPVSVGGGSQTLGPSIYTNASTFYGPTLSAGEVTLTPSLYNHNQTFYSLTLIASKTLSAALFTNAPAFYAPIVSLGSGPQVISPLLLANAQSYFTQIVTPGQVSLFPALLTNSQSFYAATVSDGSTGLPDAATRYTVTAQPRRLATSAVARSYQVIK